MTWDQILEKASSNPTYITAGIGLATFILATIIKPIRQAAIALVRLIWRSRKKRLLVHQVGSPQGNRFDEFITAYHEIFDETERTSTSEIIHWLQGKGENYSIRYFCFLCTYDDAPIAVAINMFSPEHCFSYLPFLGMTAAGQKWHLGRQAIGKLLEVTKRCHANPTHIILEMEDPQEKGIDEEEKNRRAARVRRFQGLAEACGLKMVIVDMKYQQPSYHTDTSDKNDKPMLLALLIEGSPDRHIDKQKLLEIITFVYKNVYCACFSGTKEETELYLEIVEHMLADYEQNLIPLTELRPA